VPKVLANSSIPKKLLVRRASNKRKYQRKNINRRVRRATASQAHPLVVVSQSRGLSDVHNDIAVGGELPRSSHPVPDANYLDSEEHKAATEYICGSRGFKQTYASPVPNILPPPCSNAGFSIRFGSFETLDVTPTADSPPEYIIQFGSLPPIKTFSDVLRKKDPALPKTLGGYVEEAVRTPDGDVVRRAVIPSPNKNFDAEGFREVIRIKKKNVSSNSVGYPEMKVSSTPLRTSNADLKFPKLMKVSNKGVVSGKSTTTQVTNPGFISGPSDIRTQSNYNNRFIRKKITRRGLYTNVCVDVDGGVSEFGIKLYLRGYIPGRDAYLDTFVTPAGEAYLSVKSGSMVVCKGVYNFQYEAEKWALHTRDIAARRVSRELLLAANYHTPYEGYCYITWFFQAALFTASRLDIPAVKKRLGTYPPIGEVFGLMRECFGEKILDYKFLGTHRKDKLVHAVVDGIVYYVMEKMPRFYEAYVGGTVINSTTYDMTMEDIFKKFRNMISKDSAVIKSLECDTLTHKAFVDKLRSTLPKVIVPFVIPEENMANFEGAYPELSIQWTRRTRSQHPIAATSRLLENSLMHKKYGRFGYSDIGGDLLYHVKSGHDNVHVCNPILDFKDVARREARLSQWRNMSVSHLSVDDVIVGSKCKDNFCSKRGEECKVKSSVLVAVQVYDLSVEQLCDIMINKGADIFCISLILPGEFLETHDEIVVDQLQLRIRVKGLRALYDFGGLSYSHNLPHLVTLMKTAYFYHKNFHFSFEKEDTRCGVSFIRVVRSNYMPPLDYIVTISYPRSMAGLVRVTMPIFNKKSESIVLGHEFKYYDVDFFSRCTTFICNNCNFVDLKGFEYVVNYAKSNKCRITISGKVVHRDVYIAIQDMGPLCALMLVYGVRMRMKAVAYAKVIMAAQSAGGIMKLIFDTAWFYAENYVKGTIQWLYKMMLPYISYWMNLSDIDLDNSVFELTAYATVEVLFKNDKACGELDISYERGLIEEFKNRVVKDSMEKEAAGKIQSIFSARNDQTERDFEEEGGGLGGGSKYTPKFLSSAIEGIKNLFRFVVSGCRSVKESVKNFVLSIFSFSERCKRFVISLFKHSMFDDDSEILLVEYGARFLVVFSTYFVRALFTSDPIGTLVCHCIAEIVAFTVSRDTLFRRLGATDVRTERCYDAVSVFLAKGLGSQGLSVLPLGIARLDAYLNLSGFPLYVARALVMKYFPVRDETYCGYVRSETDIPVLLAVRDILRNVGEEFGNFLTRCGEIFSSSAIRHLSRYAPNLAQKFSGAKEKVAEHYSTVADKVKTWFAGQVVDCAEAVLGILPIVPDIGEGDDDYLTAFDADDMLSTTPTLNGGARDVYDLSLHSRVFRLMRRLSRYSRLLSPFRLIKDLFMKMISTFVAVAVRIDNAFSELMRCTENILNALSMVVRFPSLESLAYAIDYRQVALEPAVLYAFVMFDREVVRAVFTDLVIKWEGIPTDTSTYWSWMSDARVMRLLLEIGPQILAEDPSPGELAIGLVRRQDVYAAVYSDMPQILPTSWRDRRRFLVLGDQARLISQDYLHHWDSHDPEANSTRGRVDVPARLLIDTACCICLTDYDNRCYVTRLPCGHVFHLPCYERWRQHHSRCPVCRTEVVVMHSYGVITGEIVARELTSGSGGLAGGATRTAKILQLLLSSSSFCRGFVSSLRSRILNRDALTWLLRLGCNFFSSTRSVIRSQFFGVSGAIPVLCGGIVISSTLIGSSLRSVHDVTHVVEEAFSRYFEEVATLEYGESSVLRPTLSRATETGGEGSESDFALDVSSGTSGGVDEVTEIFTRGAIERRARRGIVESVDARLATCGSIRKLLFPFIDCGRKLLRFFRRCDEYVLSRFCLLCFLNRVESCRYKIFSAVSSVLRYPFTFGIEACQEFETLPPLELVPVDEVIGGLPDMTETTFWQGYQSLTRFVTSIDKPLDWFFKAEGIHCRFMVGQLKFHISLCEKEFLDVMAFLGLGVDMLQAVFKYQIHESRTDLTDAHDADITLLGCLIVWTSVHRITPVPPLDNTEICGFLQWISTVSTHGLPGALRGGAVDVVSVTSYLRRLNAFVPRALPSFPFVRFASLCVVGFIKDQIIGFSVGALGKSLEAGGTHLPVPLRDFLSFSVGIIYNTAYTAVARGMVLLLNFLTKDRWETFKRFLFSVLPSPFLNRVVCYEFLHTFIKVIDRLVEINDERIREAAIVAALPPNTSAVMITCDDAAASASKIAAEADGSDDLPVVRPARVLVTTKEDETLLCTIVDDEYSVDKKGYVTVVMTSELYTDTGTRFSARETWEHVYSFPRVRYANVDKDETTFEFSDNVFNSSIPGKVLFICDDFYLEEGTNEAKHLFTQRRVLGKLHGVERISEINRILRQECLRRSKEIMDSDSEDQDISEDDSGGDDGGIGVLGDRIGGARIVPPGGNRPGRGSKRVRRGKKACGDDSYRRGKDRRGDDEDGDDGFLPPPPRFVRGGSSSNSNSARATHGSAGGSYSPSAMAPDSNSHHTSRNLGISKVSEIEEVEDSSLRWGDRCDTRRSVVRDTGLNSDTSATPDRNASENCVKRACLVDNLNSPTYVASPLSGDTFSTHQPTTDEDWKSCALKEFEKQTVYQLPMPYEQSNFKDNAMREFYYNQKVELYSVLCDLKIIYADLMAVDFVRHMSSFADRADFVLYNCSTFKSWAKKGVSFSAKEYAYCYDGVSIIPFKGKDTKGASPLVIFTDATRFLACNLFLRAVGNSIPTFTNYDTKCKIFEAPPGGGKTHTLVEIYLKYFRIIPTLVVTANSSSAKDIILAVNERILAEGIVKSEVERLGAPHVRIRTVDSYLMHFRARKTVLLLFDEVFMVHAGGVLSAIDVSGCKFFVGFGDSRQIKYISRNQLFKNLYSDVDRLFGKACRVYGEISFRCPSDVCRALSEIYGRKIASVHEDRGDTMRVVAISTVDEVPVRPNAKYLTFTQPEKRDLVKSLRARGATNFEVVVVKINSEHRRNLTIDGFVRGITNTVHEVQGGTFSEVILVRCKFQDEAPFVSEAHTIVALSRHTQKLTYYNLTTKMDDLTSTVIKRSHALTKAFNNTIKSVDTNASVSVDCPPAHAGKPVKAGSAPIGVINMFLEEMVKGSTSIHLGDVSDEMRQSPFDSNVTGIAVTEGRYPNNSMRRQGV
jgi:hypothetical protein